MADRGLPIDTIVIAVVVILNAGLDNWQETKAANAVAALTRTTAVTSSVICGGQRRRVPSSGARGIREHKKLFRLYRGSSRTRSVAEPSGCEQPDSRSESSRTWSQLSPAKGAFVGRTSQRRELGQNTALVARRRLLPRSTALREFVYVHL